MDDQHGNTRPDDTEPRVNRDDDSTIGNQSSVTPDQYPKDDDGGRPDYGSPYRD
jgi:hypothetical protein